MARSSWLLVLCVAIGAAAIVLAWLPSAWPNPLGSGPVDLLRVVPQLEPAAAAVDAACQRGDGRAFASATTAAYRKQLNRRLQVVDGTLDSSTLRAMASDTPCAQWLAQPVLAGHVAGNKAAIAVRRPNGDGAQILTFVWDGQRFLFDGTRHRVGVVRVADAERWVVEAAQSNPGVRRQD